MKSKIFWNCQHIPTYISYNEIKILMTTSKTLKSETDLDISSCRFSYKILIESDTLLPWQAGISISISNKKNYDVSWELKWFHRKIYAEAHRCHISQKNEIRKFPKIQFNSSLLVISSIYAALSLMNKLCQSTEACSNIHKLRNEINNGNFIIY